MKSKKLFEETLMQVLTFYDNYRFLCKMSEKEAKDKVMEVYSDFYEWLNEGVIEQAESNKSINGNSIPVENTVTEKEPKKRTGRTGKKSQFHVWVKNMKLGTRFTEDEFYDLHPNIRNQAKARKRVTKYISQLIQENKLVQHSKNVLEKVKY